MSSRRTLILIAAVLVGAVAAYALLTYVGGIEDEANDNAERVEIFKIVQDIPKGTFGDEAFAQGFIEQDEIAKEYRPATAITDPSQIDGLVAISDLAANQVVVTNQFVTQQDSLSTFSQLLKNNEVAITISVDQVRGVAGLLVPGRLREHPRHRRGRRRRRRRRRRRAGGGRGVRASRRATCTRRCRSSPSARPASSSPARRRPPTPTAPPADTGSSGLITFVVPAEAAQRIASVDRRSIYLTLVAKDYQPDGRSAPLDVERRPLPGETGDAAHARTARTGGPSRKRDRTTIPSTSVLRQGQAPIATNPMTLVPVAVLDDDPEVRDRLAMQLGEPGGGRAVARRRSRTGSPARRWWSCSARPAASAGRLAEVGERRCRPTARSAPSWSPTSCPPTSCRRRCGPA